MNPLLLSLLIQPQNDQFGCPSQTWCWAMDDAALAVAQGDLSEGAVLGACRTAFTRQIARRRIASERLQIARSTDDARPVIPAPRGLSRPSVRCS